MQVSHRRASHQRYVVGIAQSTTTVILLSFLCIRHRRLRFGHSQAKVSQMIERGIHLSYSDWAKYNRGISSAKDLAHTSSSVIKRPTFSPFPIFHIRTLWCRIELSRHRGSSQPLLVPSSLVGVLGIAYCRYHGTVVGFLVARLVWPSLLRRYFLRKMCQFAGSTGSFYSPSMPPCHQIHHYRPIRQLIRRNHDEHPPLLPSLIVPR